MRILCLVIAAVGTVFNTYIAPPVLRTFNNTTQEIQRLEVLILSEKHIYKKGDKINLKAMVINNSDQDIFVYGKLEWGYLASLTLCLQDAKGKSVQPRFIADAITYPPDDKSQFVRLAPYHFLGTYYIASTELLNIQKPGRYSMYVEYHSPIRSSKADVSPFYGKENGAIRSNQIWIEVQ